MSATPAASSTGSSGHANKRQRMTWRGTSSDINPLRKYTPTPTSGTAPLHSSQDFGHADFYPAKAGQNESQLSERTIRYGYVDAPRVDYEHASSHDIVYERLQDARVFQELQSFAAGTAQRQWARGCIASSDLPRLPNRAVKSDERRDEWLRGLGNPRVPLSVLANSMPFGLRGERLLESLRLHQVPLQRAVWAIRLTGVYEMFAMQTRAPDHASLKALEEGQYTIQWSKQFTQFIDHTLAAAPTGATEGEGASSSVNTPSNIAATPQIIVPVNWPRSWAFCLSLLHELYSQGLLDQRHLVSWLVNQFRNTPVDKCMLIFPLVRDYTSDVGKSRTPLRKLIGAVSFRIEQAERYPSLHLFHDQLCRYLIRLFTTFPDAFVEPTTWMAYQRALDVARKRVYGDNANGSLASLLKQVEYRNSRFSCLVAKKDSALSRVRQENCSATPLRVLATLTPDSEIAEIFDALFSATPEGTTASHVLRLICYWAVEDQVSSASMQFRQLAAAQLCKTYDSRQPAAAPSSSVGDVQRAVVGFLDIFPLPASGDSKHEPCVWRVCSLLERLADVGSFSLSRYLQLLTARGDFFGTNFDSPRSQRHLEYVLHIPLNSTELREQRQMVLYDCEASSDVAKLVDEDPALALLRTEISEMLPMLVAYTCATPLRARNSEKPPTIDLDLVRWWVPGYSASNPAVSDLLDIQNLPTAAQLTEATLQSPLAHRVCVKDWIASLSDHMADEPVLSRDLSADCLRLLHTSPRNVVDFVINRRLLPIIYDYVVKDVKVGVDNWRVITRPGTSLLNRRQTAVVIRMLIEAGLFAQLLDFLLWVLDHTTTAAVLALSHRVLRRYTPVWRQLGKLPAAIAAIEKQRKEAQRGSDTFNFELYRTAQCWAHIDGDSRMCAEQSRCDYDQSVSLHVNTLLYGSHASLPASASKDILQLAQQLIRDRVREPSGSSEAEWAITPCFQKIASWALNVTQRGDFAGGPAIVDAPNSPTGGLAARLPKLQAMLAHIVVDATQAALVTGRPLPLAVVGAPDRVKDEALLRCFVEMCAQLIHWFAVHSGLAASPDYIGPLILKAMTSAIRSWMLSRSSSSGGLSTPAATSALGHSVAATPLLPESEIEAGMHVAYIWVNSLLACGCLRLDDLIPWLIDMCREEPTLQNLAQYTGLAGIMCALGMPTRQLGERLSLPGDTSNGGDDYVACDLRHMYELLEIGSCWQATLDGNRQCRIQAIELVFANASLSGRLRGLGAARLATVLMRAATALAQSEWIISVVDHVPYSRQGSAEPNHAPYFSMLEIYQANIEGQLHDPAIVLPVKRAILRVLMTLCEGADPAAGGFSAMTTAEVAHRLRETIRRFWFGPAAKGGQTVAASKLATILNSLLLFASTALQESEATTDAFAVAAGATAIASMDDARSGAQDIGAVDRGLEHGSEQVQFVTNTTAYLSTCVLDAAFNWGSGDAPAAKCLAGQRCASLAEALCTLSPSVLLSLTESCVGSLLSLSPAKLRAAGTESADPAQPKPAASQGTGLDERVALIVGAFGDDAGGFFEINTADYNGMDLDDASAECGTRPDDDATALFAAYAERGSALAKLVQQLVQRLVLHVDTAAGPESFVSGGTLSALRDLASAVLGQIQSICLRINPAAAAQLSLKACERAGGLSSNSTTAAHSEAEEPDSSTPHALAGVDVGFRYRLRTALCWRLQVVQPMCNLFRQFPDEFGVSEWLTTLVTLCLAPACQPSAAGDRDDELYEFLLDFAAITNESITQAMRKSVLGSLRLAAPLLRSAIHSSKCAEVLGRLFPFDTVIGPTSDIQPLVSTAHIGGLDNPWVWVEALEFVPLASLNSSAIANAGLEGITPFTLRGTLQQEASARCTRPTSITGYGMGVRSNSAASIGSGSKNSSLPHRLQYLENPYFPMQPSFIFPLAETPISWQLFGGKRRRLDMESRLVWRSLCESTFTQH